MSKKWGILYHIGEVVLLKGVRGNTAKKARVKRGTNKSNPLLLNEFVWNILLVGLVN